MIDPKSIFNGLFGSNSGSNDATLDKSSWKVDPKAKVPVGTPTQKTHYGVIDKKQDAIDDASIDLVNGPDNDLQKDITKSDLVATNYEPLKSDPVFKTMVDEHNKMAQEADYLKDLAAEKTKPDLDPDTGKNDFARTTPSYEEYLEYKAKQEKATADPTKTTGTEAKKDKDPDPTGEKPKVVKVPPGNSAKNFVPGQYEKEIDFVFRSMAAGGFANQLQTFFISLDRYQRNMLPANSEHSGLTFITRPKLCLTSANLRASRVMAPLDTMNPSSISFATRCLLDTKFCKTHANIVADSGLVNIKNPFFTPLCNALTGLNGWPDPVIQTLTTDGGFFSEDQTVAIGADNLNKTYDLTLSFKDAINGPIISIFQYWTEYMRCITRGDMVSYKENIDAQRLDYTVAIYRFVLDPSRRYITKYAKATGCFPRTPPIGSMFNVDENEVFVSASQRFSVPFVANKIEYNDYAILQDFRLLMQRYVGDIVKNKTTGELNYPPLNMCPTNNLRGLPWIEATEYGMEMQYLDIPNSALSNDNNTFTSHTTPAGTKIACLFDSDRPTHPPTVATL